MKIEDYHPTDDKKKWKVVRTDSYADVPGEIVIADETTGECHLSVDNEIKIWNFGPGGIKLIGRSRR